MHAWGGALGESKHWAWGGLVLSIPSENGGLACVIPIGEMGLSNWGLAVWKNETRENHHFCDEKTAGFFFFLKTKPFLHTKRTLAKPAFPPFFLFFFF